MHKPGFVVGYPAYCKTYIEYGVSRIYIQRAGHKVYFHDLYAEKFDPILFVNEIPKDATVTC